METKKEAAVLEKEGYVSKPLSPLPPHIDQTNNAPVVPLPDNDPGTKATGPSSRDTNTDPLNSNDMSERGNNQRRY